VEKFLKIFKDWSLLYTKQKKVCGICKTELGYLLAENLGMRHLKKGCQLKY
jgi:hypothetical protein